MNKFPHIFPPLSLSKERLHFMGISWCVGLWKGEKMQWVGGGPGWSPLTSQFCLDCMNMAFGEDEIIIFSIFSAKAQTFSLMDHSCMCVLKVVLVSWFETDFWLERVNLENVAWAVFISYVHFWGLWLAYSWHPHREKWCIWNTILF